MLAGLQAGASGLPFMPVRGHLESDYLKVRQDFRLIPDPYSGEAILVVPPIAPDVALVHAFGGDREGNLLVDELEDDFLLIQASKRVIASVEAVADDPRELKRAEYGLFVSGIHVEAVVHLPHGAHPTLMQGLYGIDDGHIGLYMGAAKDEESFRGYLERYVFGVKAHDAYLSLVGLKATEP